MRKTTSFVLKIGGVVVAIAGAVCLVKWVMDEFVGNKEGVNSKDDFSSNSDEEEERCSDGNEKADINLNVVRSDAAEEISLRHQEAARMMKEMIDEIEKEPIESGEDASETENEDRLDFDDIDASLDKLFDEE